MTLQWCHNEWDGISNHQPHDCLLNCLCRSKKISKLCVTGLCVGNSPVTGEFPTQRASNTGDPLHSRALAHSRAPLFTQPCPHCSHSRAPGEQWARLCVFTLQGCVQAARLCRGSPVSNTESVSIWWRHHEYGCSRQFNKGDQWSVLLWKLTLFYYRSELRFS